jgi:hypothetical protein
MEQSRATLGRHAAAVAAHRPALATLPPASPRMTAIRQRECTVEFDGKVILGPLTLVPLRRAITCNGTASCSRRRSGSCSPPW